MTANARLPQAITAVGITQEDFDVTAIKSGWFRAVYLPNVRNVMSVSGRLGPQNFFLLWFLVTCFFFPICWIYYLFQTIFFRFFCRVVFKVCSAFILPTISILDLISKIRKKNLFFMFEAVSYCGFIWGASFLVLLDMRHIMSNYGTIKWLILPVQKMIFISASIKGMGKKWNSIGCNRGEGVRFPSTKLW